MTRRNIYPMPDDPGSDYPPEYDHEALCDGGMDCTRCFPRGPENGAADIHAAACPSRDASYRRTVAALDRAIREAERRRTLRRSAWGAAFWLAAIVLVTLALWLGWNASVVPLFGAPPLTPSQAAGLVGVACSVSCLFGLLR